MPRFMLFVGAVLLSWCSQAAMPDPETERREVEHWRAARVAELTSEEGWLTLVGLFWLDERESSFGRAASNHIVLDHPALPPRAGTFIVDSGGAHFIAQRGSGITHAGRPISAVDMVADTQGPATVLASGSLRFFVIQRSGKLGVRVRDVDSPRRRDFAPINYYPIDVGWVLEARFEPYEPHRRIRIVNTLGLEEELDSPGALVFNRNGHDWRLDALLEDPADQTLFVMFADETNGKETYGGGRFLRVPLPEQGGTRVDFNRAYNPPCAFNDFTTCQLPPFQNHLALQVAAGERTYGNGHGAAAH